MRRWYLERFLALRNGAFQQPGVVLPSLRGALRRGGDRGRRGHLGAHQPPEPAREHPAHAPAGGRDPREGRRPLRVADPAAPRLSRVAGWTTTSTGSSSVPGSAAASARCGSRRRATGSAVLECGRRFNDDELPKSTWDLRRYWYAPRLGLQRHLPADDLQGRRDRVRERRGRRVARVREHALPRAGALLRGPAVGGAGGLAGRAGAALRGGRADARRRRLRRGRPRRRLPARVRRRDRGGGDLREDARGRVPGRARQDGEGPLLRRRRSRPHRLPALRPLHDRLPARRQEHAGEELPVVRRARGRARSGPSGRWSTSSRSTKAATRSRASARARGCARSGRR